ncbi:MAG: acyltransferase family protein [Lachnospiraceae bacterium]
MSTNRRSDIDIAKGFALFLVVLGHVVTMHHTIFRWIYAFHMPAFFFLSGMTFRPEKYHPVWITSKKGGAPSSFPIFSLP